ncbi:unnamed protein product [Chrysoparadoxa australica]
MGECWIYHEKQFSSLCGQHCLNNLVQQALFSAPYLAEIARELDEKERAVMMEMGAHTQDALNFLAEDSGNVDEAGNFSVQVLSEALNRACQLRLVNVNADSADLKGKLSTTGDAAEEGFVCNRQAHWLAIRRISGRYWNLNSTLEKPEQITTFRLEATLHQHQLDGYSVFVLRGEGALPAPNLTPGQIDPESWYKEAALLKGGSITAATDVWSTSGPGQRLDGASAAPAAVDVTSSAAAPVAAISEEDQIAQAIALSLSEPAPVPAGPDPVPEAIPPEPPAGTPHSIRVQVKLRQGKFTRRFLAEDPALHLFTYTRELVGQGKAFELIGPQGKKLDAEAIAQRQGSFHSEDLANASVTARLLL